LRLILLLSLLVSACASAKNFTLCYEEWPPYALRSDEEDKGLVINQLLTAASHLSWQVNFIDLPHNRCVKGVKSGKFDGALFVDESDGLNLLQPSIAEWRLGFLVKSDHPAQTSSDIFHGLMIMALDYEYPEILIAKLNKLPLVRKRVTYYTTNDLDTKGLFNYIHKHSADVMLIDEVWAQLTIKRMKLKLRMLSPPLHVEPQYLGVAANQSKSVIAALEDLITQSQTTAQNKNTESAETLAKKRD